MSGTRTRDSTGLTPDSIQQLYCNIMQQSHLRNVDRGQRRADTRQHTALGRSVLFLQPIISSRICNIGCLCADRLRRQWRSIHFQAGNTILPWHAASFPKGPIQQATHDLCSVRTHPTCVSRVTACACHMICKSVLWRWSVFHQCGTIPSC